MKQHAEFSSAYSLAEVRKLLSAAAAAPDLRAGTSPKLSGSVSETEVCLYRRLAAPESSVKFHGRFRTEGPTVLINGAYATDPKEVAGYAIIALAVLVLAIIVAVFAMSLESWVSIGFGGAASVAIAILGWRVMHFHRCKALREAEALGRIIRNVVGEDDA